MAEHGGECGDRAERAVHQRLAEDRFVAGPLADDALQDPGDAGLGPSLVDGDHQLADFRVGQESVQGPYVVGLNHVQVDRELECVLVARAGGLIDPVGASTEDQRGGYKASQPRVGSDVGSTRLPLAMRSYVIRVEGVWGSLRGAV